MTHTHAKIEGCRLVDLVLKYFGNKRTDRRQLLFIVIRQMAAPNVHATDTLFKSLNSGCV